jgi:3-hydroxyisobutyrate dehydrogenase
VSAIVNVAGPLTTIGCVGVGRMAAPMARRLLQAGRRVCLRDPSPKATESFAGTPGALVVGSLDEVLRSSEIVLLSLPAPGVVVDVVREVAGISGSRARPIATRILLNTSTNGVNASREAASALAGTNIAFVDAPVSGGESGAGETGARDGTLTFITSGPHQAKQACQPILDILGSRFFDAGTDPGQAQALKGANNYLNFVSLMATAEAVTVLTELGIDLSLQLEIFNASSGRNSSTAVKYPQQVLTGRYDFGFPIASVVKDVSTFTDLARLLGAEAPLAREALEQWKSASDAGWGGEDCTTIGRLLASRWFGTGSA